MKTNKFKSLRATLCLALTVVMLFAVVAVPVSAAMPRVDGSRFDVIKLPDGETVRAIVVLEGNAVVDLKLDPQSATAKAHESSLLKLQDRFLSKLNKQDASVRHYTELFNGVAFDATAAELKAIEKMSGVAAVYVANTYSVPAYEVVKDDEILAQYASLMTGASTLNQVGFDGDGIVVAVIDTGVNIGHEVLQPNDLMVNPALSEEDVAAVETVFGGQYISEKIPFSYDYYDNDDDCTDENGHGSHVSGIIGGYLADGDAVLFSGAAPAVQLLGMKVFGAEGGTSSDIYFSALEDAYRLGADAVNMSLGSPSGFSYDASLETELYGNIYKKLDDAGIAVFCSAGNDYNMSFAGLTIPAQYGYTAVQGAYPDYGVVGTPSTYPSNTSVASVNNLYIHSAGVSLDGENLFSYTDPNAGTELEFKATFDGETVAFVYLPGLGDVEDFDGIDVTDKIVAIDRGSITFQEKIDNAAAAGACGVIIVNNDPTPLNMSVENLTVPAMCIDMNAKAVLLELDGTSVTFSYGEANMYNPNAGTMSDFSSWGPTADLLFKPEIAGIGGYVYSSVNGASDAYDVYSGTSMACPNVVGSYAALLSYLRAICPDMDKYTMSVVAEDLMLSTAWVLNDGYSYYSPRQQGAGLADVVSAVLAPAYITNATQSAGYDADKTGVITLTYHVVSLSDETGYYTIVPALVTDTIADFGLNNLYNTTDPLLLEEGVDYECEVYTEFSDGKTDTGMTFALYAGLEADVTVTITLSDDAKGYLDLFENGAFVDGYLFFYDYEELVLNDIGWIDSNPVDLFHGSFISFYGDWLAAPALENYSTFDLLDTLAWLDENGYLAAGYGIMDVLEDFNIGYNEACLYDMASGDSYDLGANPFGDGYNYVNMDRNAFSTELSNADLYFFDSVLFYPSVLRNCRNLIMTVVDAETGDVYYVDDTPFIAKDALSSDGSSYSKRSLFMWDGTNSDGEYVPSGTKAYIVFETLLAHPDAERRVEWVIPVTVDYTAPVIYYVYDDETKLLTVSVTDSEYLSYLNIYDPDWEVDYVMETYADDEAGLTYTYEIDLSEYEYDVIYIDAVDYATNAVSLEVPLTLGSISNIPVSVALPDVEGVTITAEDTAYYYTDYNFTVSVNDGYCLVNDGYTVSINGEALEPVSVEDGVYSYSYPVRTTEDLILAIEGVMQHDFVPVVSYPATCDSIGYVEYRCSNCDLLDHNEIIAAYGHVMDGGELLEEATCTTEGRILYTCTVCGESQVVTTPALGHTPGEWEVTKEPTYTEEGEQVRKCTVCGEIVETEAIPVLEGMLGDVDNNGKIDALDYLLVKRHVLETITLTEDQIKRADITQNGDVDALDYLLIKRIVLETIEWPLAQ